MDGTLSVIQARCDSTEEEKKNKRRGLFISLKIASLEILLHGI